MITRGKKGSMKRRGTRNDIEIKRGKGIEKEAMRRARTRGGKRETRRGGEKNGTESTGLRGRDGDTRKVEMEKEIEWKSLKERREIGIERESDPKMNIKSRGMTKKDERDMETESIWK